MSISTQEIASAVLDIIPDASRWVKKAYETDSGSHCISGALRRLCLDTASSRDFYARFDRIASSEYPERVRSCRFDDGAFLVVLFNDHPDTSYSDVRRVLEKMAAG